MSWKKLVREAEKKLNEMTDEEIDAFLENAIKEGNEKYEKIRNLNRNTEPNICDCRH